ncbi:MAG TPA: hypothetical protein VFX16_26640 [Pseudonocardiaceae bacterium]|nr:hypothetical protein [Pseudonocardiaceae bacterium]
MYEDIVAEARRTSEAAVRESQERVNLAVTRTEEADKQASEASKSFGERWSNRINAMRRRAADRAKSTEMSFGHEDGPHPNDRPDGDELVSLVEPTTPAAADDRTPPFGVPQELIQQQVQPTYGRHASDPASDRFMSAIGPEVEEDHRPPQPPRRPQPPARRARSHDDDDDDYSGQSWLEGR